MNLPDRFIERIQTQKYIDTDDLKRALNDPSPVSIRINTSKWSGIPEDSEPVTWCRSGFYLAKRPSFTLDPLFHAGCYYPQEASSMFLEQAVDQVADNKKNLRILDLCGAPGGKSTHLSGLFGSGCLLVANEVIRQRALILAETLTKWGTDNTMVTQSDPHVFGKMTGFFDVILVDAPCSGEGMFRTDVAIKEWSPENTFHCAERQKRILADVWPGLKDGGLLIYSTCTFNPAENEENIKWLLESNEAECVELDISSFKGITEIDYMGIRGYGFYPGRIKGEGFFLSVVRKKGISHTTRKRHQGLQEFKPAREEITHAGDLTGFPDERIIKWKEDLFALPCDPWEYAYLLDNTRIVKPGTRLFTIKKNGIIPSHELALSPRLKRGAFPVINTSIEDALTYLRKNNLKLNNIEEGWNIVRYNKACLGFVKNLGSRINNYYPVEWRIRLDVGPSEINEPVRWK